MSRGPFEPVTVELSLGERKIVGSAEEVAEFLAFRWPGERSPLYRVAVELSMDEMLGRCSCERVRMAFIAAAHEAGILVSTTEIRAGAAALASQALAAEIARKKPG